jgi:DNA primase
MSDSTSFKSVVAEVKLAYNIVDYIQQAGVALKPNGAAKWKGLCPFHNEKSPSFTVDEHFQNFRCFGCGVSGDILRFIEFYEHLDFTDALQKLAEDKGIELNFGHREDGVDYKSVRAALKATANFFYQQFKKLDEGHPARKEVLERGLSLTGMRYGYAPDGFNTLYSHLKEAGFSDEVILHTGAVKFSEKTQKHYDFWNGRLMFFITDATGKPIGFSGRKLFEEDQRGKYVNSPDGVLFDKGASLFNISGAKAPAGAEKEVFIAEGQFDVAAFIEGGLPQVVASSGTAFTEKQAMMCRRLVTENGRIIFAFDGDKAGVKAALSVFQHVPMIHSQAYAVLFPAGQDPCDYRLEHGNEAFQTYVRSATVPLLEFVLSATARGYNLDNPVESTQFVQAAARLLKTVTSLPLRESYLRQVALDAFVPVDTIREAVAAAEPFTAAGSAPEVPEAQKAPVRSWDTEEDQQELFELISADSCHELSARLLAITLTQQELAPLTLQFKDDMPEAFHRLITELAALPQGATPLPEVFTDARLAEHLISTNFFPLAHLMTEDYYRAQYRYIHTALRRLNRSQVEQRIRGRIASILQKSPEQGVDFLKKALAKEESELARLPQLAEAVYE